MSQSFTVDSSQLRALAAAWEASATVIANNPAPDVVARCPADLAGSHTAWVCSQATVRMSEELTNAVRRITEIVGAATASSTSYDGVDGVQAATYTAGCSGAVS
jgi:hypothetical protein